MYCLPVGVEEGGLPFCNHQIRIVKSTRFVKTIKSTIFHNLFFSGNKPQNPDYDWYTGILKINKEFIRT